ncbi:MAG: 37S ribosomal protein S9, mitochondrial [Geoglossum simile]|nr:MAG: 37S ribosomal protein S9, mitochondrial [Geoglossum simile]
MRQFVSSPKRSGIAAPEISFESKDDQCDIPGYARVVPASPSYFTGKPDFTDNLISLQDLLRKYQTLPVVQPGQAPRVAWKTLAQYRLLVGEPVKAAKYHKIILLLQRLNRIHPSLLSEDVKSAVAPYRRDVNPHENVANQRSIDHFGRVVGVGRRKSSTARVWLVEGDGEVSVNGKSLTSAFSRIHDRESAIWALKATERIDKYNVWALVEGGGTTGQAEAMTLAVAKALLVHEPSLKPALRRGMLLVSLHCFELPKVIC